jgi:hypothetical protein
MFKTSSFIFNGACFLGVLEAHMSITADFFRNRLDQMIDLRHPLAVLSNRMPWQESEASPVYNGKRPAVPSCFEAQAPSITIVVRSLEETNSIH